jgi:hypothetical protein
MRKFTTKHTKYTKKKKTRFLFFFVYFVFFVVIYSPMSCFVSSCCFWW